MLRCLLICHLALCLLLVSAGPARAQSDPPTSPLVGNMIFIHPDGASAASFAAVRNLLVGPDGDLHWDRLPAMALYRGHLSDSLTATSNAGATIHAYGIKVPGPSYGLDGEEPITDAEGNSLSVAHQAIRAGLPVGVVNSGTSTEPGTGCFLTSVPKRSMHDEIAVQLIESGAEVILGGGEQFFLPEGVKGRHGVGVRADDRNVIEEARQKGYHVVFTREELADLPDDVTRLLGIFAANQTFNDKPEEVLAQVGLPLYWSHAPTVAEMTQAALTVLGRHDKRFLLVVEEEGTDNFGNKNNAKGKLEALRRADEAIGVARAFVADHPETMILTASDSEAGGMYLQGVGLVDGEPPAALPERDVNGAPMDGQEGTGTAPFIAAPDRNGNAWPFAITWAARDDVTGGILVRAEGLNAHLVRGNIDNTEIPALMRLTLFGRSMPE